MFVVFLKDGYKTFDNEESALNCCKQNDITWVDYGGWE